ncbi:MAG: hypothetical protein P1V97_17345 [Planctomycetota bacterium]|nr:hypothetical protein [Planctomycetota bacterium]
MNCQNTKNSLTIKNVDLLSKQEESELNNHLKDCQPCQKQSTLLDDAYKALECPDDDQVSLGSIWEGIQSDIQNAKKYPPLFTEKPAGNNLVIALSCSYCHGPLPRSEACYCASCLSPHHNDCFRTYGRCTSMGCEETHTVKPQLNQAPVKKSVRKRSHIGLIGLAIGAPILVVGLAAGLGVNRYHAAKDQALMARKVAEDQAKALQMAEKKAKQPVEITVFDDPPSMKSLVNGPMKTREANDSKIDIEVMKMDLNDVVEEIAKKANHNILVDPGISERVTVKLRAIPWRQALNLIAKMAHCEIEEPSSNILMLTQPPKVTLQFHQANIRTVLQLLAAYSGKNVLIDNNVTGSVAVDFKETRWDIALGAIVQVNGLFAQQNKSIIIVSRTPFKKRWGTEFGQKTKDPVGKTISLYKTATLTEIARDLSTLSDKPIVVKDRSDKKYNVKIKEVPWTAALKFIANKSQREILDTGRQYVLLPVKDNFFHAKNAPTSVWIQALGNIMGKNIISQTTLSSRFFGDFNDVSALAALQASSYTMFLQLEERAGVLTVHPHRTKQSTPTRKPGSSKVFTVDGRKYSLQLQATLGNQKKRIAIISGNAYSIGDRFTDEDEEEIPFGLAEIQPSFVKLNVYETDAKKAGRVIKLEFPVN